MTARWTCPKCKRTFNQVNQRHACGTGDRAAVVRNRPEHVVKLFDEVERFAQSLGKIEVVTRERYVLLRTTRIFADLVIMTDCVRIAVHLKSAVKEPLYFKVVKGDRAVTHVAKLKSSQDFAKVKPHLKQAFEFSLGKVEQ